MNNVSNRGRRVMEMCSQAEGGEVVRMLRSRWLPRGLRETGSKGAVENWCHQALEVGGGGGGGRPHGCCGEAGPYRRPNSLTSNEAFLLFGFLAVEVFSYLTGCWWEGGRGGCTRRGDGRRRNVRPRSLRIAWTCSRSSAPQGLSCEWRRGDDSCAESSWWINPGNK